MVGKGVGGKCVSLTARSLGQLKITQGRVDYVNLVNGRSHIEATWDFEGRWQSYCGTAQLGPVATTVRSRGVSLFSSDLKGYQTQSFIGR